MSSFVVEDRKKRLLGLVTEAVRVLKEQDPAGVAPPSAVPPSPVPPAPETNSSAPPAGAPPAPGAPEQKPFDVDAMIDRLNVIRGGKSFADPEVYGQLTSYFKGLSDPDKAVIDQFLQAIGKVVIQVDSGSSAPGTPSATTQPPMNQQPGATPPVAPAPAPMPAPVAEALLDEHGDLLMESLKPDVKFRINDKEFDLGSPQHLKILKGVLMGLVALRDCHNIGSANRHVYSAAGARLRRHINSFSPKG